MVKRLKVGTYFYPWYNEQRWQEAARPYTPFIGEYHSADPQVISWQIDQIVAAAIDYVIFEIVPQDDWCFATMRDATQVCIEQLRARNLQWSFLIDSNINPSPRSATDEVFELVDYIERAGWTDGLVTGSDRRPMLFHFAPLPDDAKRISRGLGSRYEMIYPVYVPHWGRMDSLEDFLPFFHPHIEGAIERGITVYDDLKPNRFIAFWQCNDELLVYDGICSIEPGYDDLLLSRNPQLAPVVERRDGRHYRNRIRQALATDAQHILIYSWNECFEGSTIEPTKEYGSHYVDLTRRALEEGIR